jgi:hypothetical protein
MYTSKVQAQTEYKILRILYEHSTRYSAYYRSTAAAHAYYKSVLLARVTMPIEYSKEFRN